MFGDFAYFSIQIHHGVSTVVYQRTLRHIMYLRTQPEVSYLRSIHRDQASAKMPFSAGYFDIFLFAVSSLFRLKFFFYLFATLQTVFSITCVSFAWLGCRDSLL